jgi:hypothetical protein
MAESPTASPASAKKPSRFLKRLKLTLILVPLLAALLFVGYVWLALRVSYSDGERAGYVQKFSRKGWVCKTWEGQLAMASMPGAMPEIFPFTVRDDAVASRINAQVGQRVVLVYEEHRGIPTTCFGETGHFVVDVKRVEP